MARKPNVKHKRRDVLPTFLWLQEHFPCPKLTLSVVNSNHWAIKPTRHCPAGLDGAVLDFEGHQRVFLNSSAELSDLRHTLLHEYAHALCNCLPNSPHYTPHNGVWGAIYALIYATWSNEWSEHEREQIESILEDKLHGEDEGED